MRLRSEVLCHCFMDQWERNKAPQEVSGRELVHFENCSTDDSAAILKKLLPDTTNQDDQNDEYLGYGLQLLEIYGSDEEEDETIN